MLRERSIRLRNAVELVRLRVDIIVTAGPADTRAATEATSTIPIVMTQDPDPVENGFVASLARPGGNITGLSRLAPELSGKRLELLKEIVPRLSRVAVFGTSTEPGNAQSLRETELAARALGVKLQYLDIVASKDIETAFKAARTGRADAVLVLASPILTQRKQIADRASTSRIPTIYGNLGFSYRSLARGVRGMADAQQPAKFPRVGFLSASSNLSSNLAHDPCQCLSAGAPRARLYRRQEHHH